MQDEHIRKLESIQIGSTSLGVLGHCWVPMSRSLELGVTGGLYSEIVSIMGNGHMGPPAPVNRMIDRPD